MNQTADVWIIQSNKTLARIADDSTYQQNERLTMCDR
jgi:hypothetical protein